MTISEWIIIIGNLAVLIGVVIALITFVYQVRSFRKQLTIQNFSDYTKRYQEIILNFPEDINDQNFQLKSRPDLDKTMRYMRAYFDLCFEEFYLHQRKLIDKELWNVWKNGMEFAFSKPAFRQAWEIIKSDTQYRSEFELFIENALVHKNKGTVD